MYAYAKHPRQKKRLCPFPLAYFNQRGSLNVQFQMLLEH